MIATASPLAGLRERIAWWLVLCLLAVLLPSVALWLFEREEQQVLERIDRFHGATIRTAQASMLIVKELRDAAVEPGGAEDASWRRSRKEIARLRTRLEHIRSLQAAAAWPEAAATVGRLEQELAALPLADAAQPPGHPRQVPDLRALSLTLDQLRLLHEVELDALVGLGEKRDKKFWRLGLPALLLTVLVGAWLGALVWRSIGRSLDEDARLRRALEAANESLEQRVAERTAELRHALEDLRETQSTLVRREKLAGLGAMVAGIAHELSTPLGNCVMLASTMREQMAAMRSAGRVDELVALLADALPVLERNLSRASRLIASFKQVSVDRTSERRRRFDLRTTVQETLDALSPTLGKTRHRVVLEVTEGLELDSYPGALSQVLTNLVGNAVTHGFEGRLEGGTIRIAAMATEGGMVSLSVSDDGRGIAAEHQDRLFDPFFTTRLGRGGSGLGLHLVYSLVTSVLGGSVGVESAPGAGARFTLRLPRVAPQEREVA